MTEPEIARRCPACGVSIRDRALFCPQCGTEIPANPAQTATQNLDSHAGVAEGTDEISSVEKLRQISTTVIDEAAYDPSLRFVLVAAVLFILFLVILILSELIT
jgi:uncharacterized membrane protein YvbJ